MPVNSDVLVDLKNIEIPEITIFLMEALCLLSIVLDEYLKMTRGYIDLLTTQNSSCRLQNSCDHCSYCRLQKKKKKKKIYFYQRSNQGVT